MDIGAWWARVRGAAKSWIQLSTHTDMRANLFYYNIIIITIVHPIFRGGHILLIKM